MPTNRDKHRPGFIRVCISAMCVLFFCRAVPLQARSPNFVVILTDDQSWVGTSVEMIPGDPRTRSDYFLTPNIERLARMGMLFTQGYTPGASCCPSRRALQTGQMPARHEYNADREGWTAAYREQLNIPRMLKSANPDYVAAHFGKWDHRYDEISPYQQGYDFSDGYTGNANGGSKGSGGPAATPDPKLVDTLTDEAIHFIDRQKAAHRPFYLQVSHYAVHLDIYYNAATLEYVEEHLTPGRKHNMPQFAAMTSDLDAAVGRLLDKLVEADLLDDTYVFFLSDNGGRTSIPGAPSSDVNRNDPLRGGKHTFYEGGIRVPFIAVGPGIKPGSVCRVPVNAVDLFPTMADLAEYPDPLPDDIDGGSLRELLHNEGRGTVPRPRPFLVYHQAVDRKPITAIRMGDFKLIKHWTGNRLELFNIAEDLSETTDLSEQLPAKTQELHNLMMTYLREVGAAIPTAGKEK